MEFLGLKLQSAPWFAYYLFARNFILHNCAKKRPMLQMQLSPKGHNIQKLGLALYQNKAKQLASVRQ